MRFQQEGKGAQAQKYPQYCWEFHDRLWEALSGFTSEKRSAPSRTGGEIILEMLWKPQMPWIIGFGASQPYSRREFQEMLWERFRGLSGIFPEFLPESASRTGGCGPQASKLSFIGNLIVRARSRVFVLFCVWVWAKSCRAQNYSGSRKTFPGINQGQILAVWILAAKLPILIWNLPWILRWIFFLRFFQEKGPKKSTKKKTLIHLGICSEKFTSDFCRSLFLSENYFLKNYWLYFGIGPVWDELLFPVIFRLCSSCRTKHWNRLKAMNSSKQVSKFADPEKITQTKRVCLNKFRLVPDSRHRGAWHGISQIGAWRGRALWTHQLQGPPASRPQLRDEVLSLHWQAVRDEPVPECTRCCAIPFNLVCNSVQSDFSGSPQTDSKGTKKVTLVSKKVTKCVFCSSANFTLWVAFESLLGRPAQFTC